MKFLSENPFLLYVSTSDLQIPLHLQGYFQALFACVEDLLLSLNVKDLVLPAADEAESLWKNRFGFEKLEQEKVS